MKILFTGGGSGGHFYPLIAIAEEVLRIAKEERLIPPQLFLMAPEPYDARLLFEKSIVFIPVSTGKMRRYKSRENITDIFRTTWGIISAAWKIFALYPDVVVGKGGFGSFPALCAARLFGIPVIIHESDSVPGRVNKWAGKFARRIAVSFSEAAQYFPAERVAHTGNPMRKELFAVPAENGADGLSLELDIPAILVLGGSLGAVTLNEAVLASLPELLTSYQVILQAGRANLSDLAARAGVALQNNPHKSRFHPFGYLAAEELSRAASAASIIISRAGSTIFELAAWGKPAILVPISESNGNHQYENAYNYSRTGAAAVVEETNLRPAILVAEVAKILGNSVHAAEMSRAALSFAKLDAAEVIAREILEIALKHER